MPIPSATTWTAERTAELLALWNSGVTAPDIALRLGLTRHTVESRIAKLRRRGQPIAQRRSRRLAPPARLCQRRCLHCGKDFASLHIGNRICPPCLEDGPFTSALV